MFKFLSYFLSLSLLVSQASLKIYAQADNYFDSLSFLDDLNFIKTESSFICLNSKELSQKLNDDLSVKVKNLVFFAFEDTNKVIFESQDYLFVCNFLSFENQCIIDCYEKQQEALQSEESETEDLEEVLTNLKCQIAINNNNNENNNFR